MINWLSLAVMLFVLYRQIHNLVKNRPNDGALKMRIILILGNIALIVHVIKLMMGHTQGIFLFVHVLLFGAIYEMDVIKKYFKK